MGQFLKKLSETLQLTKIYTNQCVGCTTVTKAKHEGLKKSDVWLITCHKDARSINNYDRPSDERIQLLNSAISLDLKFEQNSSLGTEKSCSRISATKEAITIGDSPEKKMGLEVLRYAEMQA